MGKRIADSIATVWHYLVTGITFEWILRTPARRSNGGDVILARSFLTTAVAFLFVLGLENFLDTHRTWQFTMDELRKQMVDKLPWFGAIFAAIYAALYTRFSSQWTYLANVYNQIKAAEVKAASPKKASEAQTTLAEWKAGFIEDAENLHLATKESVAPIIYQWFNDDAVATAYKETVPGGIERYRRLLNTITRVTHRIATRHGGSPFVDVSRVKQRVVRLRRGP